MARTNYFRRSDAESYLEMNPDETLPELVQIVANHYQPHPSNRKRFEKRVAGLLRLVKDEQAPAQPDRGPVVLGVVEAPEDMRQSATGDTFVFTSAQSNTFLNEKFWNSLMHLVADKGAQLHVSRFTYNKQSYGKQSVKPGTHDDAEDDLWFDPRIEPYVSDESLQITPDLVWCGELNIIPTRVDPIMGFENYGRGSSVILPHTKMHMRSIPTMKYEEPRFAYTTGTVTARNYIEKAAGQKASLHHVYGALLVEVDRDTGTWWARQLNADNEGNIYDLTTRYTPEGKTKFPIRVEVVTHGDLHGYKLDLGTHAVAVDVVQTLKPNHQVFHDTIDFMPRNHHNIKDPHFLHKMHAGGLGNVEQEFEYISAHMVDYQTEDCKYWIITSNHDQAIEGWLRNTTAFYDPENMEFWLRLNYNSAFNRRIGYKPKPFATEIKLKLMKAGAEAGAWQVIDEDESLKIAGIEHGMHGHLGPNGARGNPKNLRTAGKANTGHTHSAGIVDGVYTAGVYGELDMGYNKGLSSWSHSFILTYANGKRTICTIKDGKAWR